MNGNRQFWVVSAAVLAACGGQEQKTEANEAAATAANHNILLVIADDVGADQLGIYGMNSSPPNTPNIDGLAQNGQVYRQAWANPLCSPTRASLYTGKYAFRHGVGQAIASSSTRELAETENTVAELLATVGYASGLVGKWHLGDEGSESDPCAAAGVQGWDYFAGILAGAPPSYYRWPKCVNSGAQTLRTVYASTDNVDDGINFIAGQSGPWMLTLAFNSAHTPYQLPPAGTFTSSPGNCPSGGRISASTDCYKPMIESLDHELGRLLATIDLSNTTVIFMGDNGSTAQTLPDGTSANNQAKGTVYQGGVHVPLIIRSPLITQTGDVTRIVHTLDIFDTVREISGAARPAGIDSVSLVPYFSNRTRSSLRAVVYADVFGGQVCTEGQDPATCCTAEELSAGQCQFCQNGDASAIRDARYKLIRKYSGSDCQTFTDEFYDLQLDQFEATNLMNNLSVGQAARKNALAAAMVNLRGY